MNKAIRAGRAVAVAAAVAMALAGCTKEDPNGEIVARVNGAAIYASSLDMELVRHEQRLLERGEMADPDQMGTYRDDALQKLIDTKLLYQEAVRAGHGAGSETVDEQLQGLIGGFESEQRFDEALAELGIRREDLRRDLEHGLSIQQLIVSKIEPAVRVSPEDVRAFYDSHPELFTESERVRARHILLQVPPEGGEAEAEQARRTLEELRRRVLAGEDFSALARAHSQGPSAPEGGDLGYFGRGDTVEPFEEAAFALEAGELSGVVVSPFGYHLIQVLERIPPTPVSFEEILAPLTQYLEDQKVSGAVDELARELRAKAKITIVGGGG